MSIGSLGASLLREEGPAGTRTERTEVPSLLHTGQTRWPNSQCQDQEGTKQKRAASDSLRSASRPNDGTEAGSRFSAFALCREKQILASHKGAVCVRWLWVMK